MKQILTIIFLLCGLVTASAQKITISERGGDLWFRNNGGTAKPFSQTTVTALALKAPLASPTFTGTPTAPTAATTATGTQIASVQFVKDVVANSAGGGGSTPVVDNLGSSSPSSALSAKQGKALNDTITAIKTRMALSGIEVDSTEFDTLASRLILKPISTTVTSSTATPTIIVTGLTLQKGRVTNYTTGTVAGLSSAIADNTAAIAANAAAITTKQSTLTLGAGMGYVSGALSYTGTNTSSDVTLRRRTSSAVGGGTGLNNLGFISPSTLGAAATTSTLANNNAFTRKARITYPSAATLAATAGAKIGNTLFTADDMTIVSSFGISDPVSVTSAVSFFGIAAATTFGNASPTTFANVFGVCIDAGDANLSLLTNDASGTGTKTDLGSNFPATTTLTDFYKFSFVISGAGTSYTYTLTNASTGLSTTGTVTSNLPSPTTATGAIWWRNNNTQSLVVGVDVAYFEVISF